MAKPLPNPLPYFAQISDPRRETRNKRHLLEGILALTLCGMLAGADDWESIAEFGRTKEAGFKTFLRLPNGIPSPDTFGRVFSLLKPAEVEMAFQGWVSAALERLNGSQVVLDGKTLRGSQQGKAKSALPWVSAWVHEHGMVVGQREVDTKSNEITALPELLKLLDLEGATVSIDAMGCQTARAEQMIEGQAD
jgi:DDE_Tnp_1-associated